MRPALPTLTVALAALALLTGCRGATLSEKVESVEVVLAPSEALRLGTRLTNSTARVIAGGVLKLDPRDRRTVLVTPRLQSGLTHGTATALSADGYYLTAAHNVQTPPVWLALPTIDDAHEPAWKVQPGRVVWAGDPEQPAQDLAILKTVSSDVTAQEPLAWIPLERLVVGQALVSAGALTEDRKDFSLAAGSLSRLPDPPVAPVLGGLPSTLVVHDIPSRKGDSGGPVCTADGRLVGIAVRGLYPWGEGGEAAAPDPEWLQRVIRLDRRLERSQPRPRSR